jgi:predicted N-acyltransferase
MGLSHSLPKESKENKESFYQKWIAQNWGNMDDEIVNMFQDTLKMIPKIEKERNGFKYYEIRVKCRNIHRNSLAFFNSFEFYSDTFLSNESREYIKSKITEYLHSVGFPDNIVVEVNSDDGIVVIVVFIPK